MSGVVDQRDPKGGKLYFLRRIPRDPMAETANEEPARDWVLRSYASEAERPHPGADVFDVASRSSAVAINGTPYAQW